MGRRSRLLPGCLLQAAPGALLQELCSSTEASRGGQGLAFSANTGLPESSERCRNSKCRVPNSAKMLLPADAQLQLQLMPLRGEKREPSAPEPQVLPWHTRSRGKGTERL